MKTHTPMTELPDGSGCFTATIMSNEEAMALPLKERPLNHRISGEMYHAVFEAIGEASMCWNPNPSGVFDSEKASDVAVRLCFKIAGGVESAVELIAEIMRGEVNAEDECEKWLRAYAPHHLFPKLNASLHARKH